MLYKIKLQNSNDQVLVDDKVYDRMSSDPYLQEIGLLDKLRRHSSGVAVFQKLWSQSSVKSKMTTIYLHRYIAEQFLTREGSENSSEVVRFMNGNKLDCRLDNLKWTTRTDIARRRKAQSNSGYKGVYKEYNKYRAVISYEQQNIHLGMFSSAQEAASAYKKKSEELFGPTADSKII